MPDEVTVTIRRLSSGRIRFDSPQLPGWARALEPREPVGRIATEALTEAQIADYSRQRGVEYDGAEHAPPRRRPGLFATGRAGGRLNPADWTPLPDGRWLSPGGRRYGADTQRAREVRRARERLGLPTQAAADTA